MKIATRRLDFFAVMVLMLGSVATADREWSGRDAVAPPGATAQRTGANLFFDRAKADGEAQVAALRAQFGPEYQPHFSPLFSLTVRDDREGRTRGWLAGCMLGTVPGNGMFPLNRCCLVSESGDVLVDFEKAKVGAPDSAVVIERRGAVPLAAMSFYGGRALRGSVKVVTIEARPRELLVYACPEQPWWYSTLYFANPGDGDFPRILVHRVTRDFDGGWKREEHLLFRYDPGRQRYGEGEAIDAAGFEREVGQGSQLAPHIEQVGPPYDAAADRALQLRDDRVETKAPTTRRHSPD